MENIEEPQINKISDDHEKDADELLDELEIKEGSSQEEECNVDSDFVDEVALKDSQTDLTEEELEQLKNDAISFKEEGNSLFKLGNFIEARSKYTAALNICPLQNENERSILFANRGICNMKEDRKNEALEDCTKALELNPTYLKALKRRATLYEETDKFDESLEDYKKLYDMDPSDQSVTDAIQRLPPKIEERNAKLKEQMLGTLKDLGNKILKPFGLSTSNFQLQQDSSSGGYTINFNQNKT